jgi:anti-sigma regulatory factor (Ser/Thr protein kinase)
VDRVEKQLAATEGSATEARVFLRAALQTWELDGFGAVTEVLTSELVTNVVRHVGAPMTLRALRQPSTIRVEVDDPSTGPPVVQHPQPLDEHGRGLFLIDSLADEWGVTPHGEDGKTVWFEIDVTTATDEVHGG